MINYDKIKVLTFSKGSFKQSQEKLKSHLISIGINNLINYSDSDLPKDFIDEFQDLFEQKRGYGYWIWKPFIILKELDNLTDDEILIYMDSTDQPSNLFFEILNNHLKKEEIYLVNRGYKNGEWTKRDCFIMMNCDDKKYHNSIQLEAGVLGLKKTDNNIKLLTEWFEFCKNRNILTDLPNTCGLENLEGFKDHRHDQSILTNLSIKYGLKSYKLNQNIIWYNYNQPQIYG
jgi:23S rRNA maturation mini-RNase III